MCEYRTGYPIEREDGVIFMDPKDKIPTEIIREAIRLFSDGNARESIRVLEKAAHDQYWEGQVEEYYNLRRTYFAQQGRTEEFIYQHHS